MINISNDIFDTVAKRVAMQYPGAYCSAVYVPAPPRFPAVSVVEASNTVLQSMRTLKVENAASVMYEVNVYSNAASMAKDEAEAIAAIVDDTMADIGFTRTMMNPIPNMADNSIYRLTIRYEATVDSDLWIYHN